MKLEATGARRGDEPDRGLLRELLDLSVHEIYVLDPATMRFALASAGALANLGYTLDELRTLSPADVAADYDAARTRERIGRLLRGERKMMTFSTRNRRKDGSTYPVLLRIQRVDFEGQAAILGVAIDETDRVDAERKAKERSELYRRLAENSRDAIFRCVLDVPQFEYWSPATREVLGFEPAEAMADPDCIRDRLGPEGQALLSAAKERVARFGEQATFETAYVHPSGQRRWLLVRLRLARDEQGRPLAVEGSMTDITERKRAEDEVRALNAELEVRVRDRTRDLEEANRALDAFAHSISHDLRAPLRSISGFTKIMLEEGGAALNDEARAAAHRVLAAAGRADRLTLDLLALCRVDRHPLRRSRCDLGAMARRINDELAEQTDRHVETVIARDLYADADEALVDNVMRGLLDNAWKFTRTKPSPRVEVGVESRDGERVFFVRDNGIGFDMAKVDQVFAPLERLHGIEEYEGTGLGLPMAKRSIERHGGRLWATATPQKGATFYFTLAPRPGAPVGG